MSEYRGFFYQIELSEKEVHLSGETIDNIIRSIIREHHFRPCEIDAFFLDAKDYHGIAWWYEDLEIVNKKLSQK